MEQIISFIITFLAGVSLSIGQIHSITDYHTSFLSNYIDDDTEIFKEVPTALDSQFSAPDSIPDLLQNSLSYQQALVGEAFSSSQNIPDPLTKALVNIRCSYLVGDTIKSTTGSGFFISEKGIILTSAHVAQYFLLEAYQNNTTDCTIHTGDPATPNYKARILYISPAWIKENAEDIKKSTPTGTGERDYALLLITASNNSNPLPETYPALPFTADFLSTNLIGDSVIAMGYPAESFLANEVNIQLTPLQTETPITQLYTFGSMTADVIALKGSPLGTYGASGGPVLLTSNEVVGIITTRGDDETGGEGSLRAVTLSHINQTLREESGSGLKTHISGDVAKRSELFLDTIAPFLQRLLYNQL